jgi:prephenate dehydratase
MTESIFVQGVDLALRKLPSGAPVRLATLGPEGTSSEATASALATTLVCRGHESAAVRLYESYEAAGHAALDGEADLLVVANAYAGVSEFYMDPRMRLVAAFVKDTPSYGLAASKVPGDSARLRIASHPAPIPLIGQLLPEGLAVAEIVAKSSTSAAAQAAAGGQVDAALTTNPAALRHGLTFFSRTRTIRMLWSVFAAEHATEPRTRLAGAR